MSCKCKMFKTVKKVAGVRMVVACRDCGEQRDSTKIQKEIVVKSVKKKAKAVVPVEGVEHELVKD